MEDLGVEIDFADGTYVVDRAYVAAIREATNDDARRYTFNEAMKLVGPYFGRQFIRRAQTELVRNHLAEFGRH